jgi:hypothetical protein
MAIRIIEEGDSDFDRAIKPFVPDGNRDTFYSGARAGMREIMEGKR